ncbi:MAG: hypothetical protein HY554_18435, partial [Elusimicrobia bacterium]|nr:hypothetical protein [Elusimicrobiota bacterium]
VHVTGGWTSEYTNVDASAEYVSFAYSVKRPFPLPFVYHSGPNVYFDWVITSTFTLPSLTGVTVASSPVTAPFTTKTYDLIVGGGAGFLDLGDFKLRTKVLLNGGEQDDVTVLSATYLSSGSLSMSIRLNPPISGGPYDIQLINPDGQTVTLDDAFGIPDPGFSFVTDPDGDSFVSGAAFVNNAATSGVYRWLKIHGSGLMNWGGDGTSSVQILNGGVPVSGITAASIANLTGSAGEGAFDVGLTISTGISAGGGPYTMRVTNPDGQQSLDISNTFYMTLATATVSYPILNFGLQTQPGDALRPMTTGFAVIMGSMSFTPRDDANLQAWSDGGASTGTQIRITRNTDGYLWNDTNQAFEPSSYFTSTETQYINTASSSPWSYVWNAADGEYDIVVRGRTSDQPKTVAAEPAYTGVGGPDSTILRLLKDSKAPSISILRPEEGIGANGYAATPLQFTVNEALGSGSTGSGIQKIWFVVMTTNPADANTLPYASEVGTATWVSWCSGTGMPACSCGSDCWDTDNQGQVRYNSAGVSANPALEFTAKTLFKSVSISSYTGDVRIPEFQDGKDYYIVVISTDNLGQVGSSETTGSTGSWKDALPLPGGTTAGFRFLYDVTVPTVSVKDSLLALSTNSATPSSVAEFLVASGTVHDNVASLVSPRSVFLRIRDLATTKYLNPNTLIKFDVTTAGSAWSEYSTISDTWTFDTPSAQFVTGNSYSLEIYAKDGAGNQDAASCPFIGTSGATDCRTGDSSSPKFVRYFLYDKSKPSVSITSPTVMTPSYVGGNYGLKVMSGTSSDNSVSANESKVARVEFTLQVNESEPAKRWQGNVSSEPWKAVAEDLWIMATPSGPLGDPWAVWIASNIAWFESDSYILKVRSIDNAGNVSNEASRSFYVDRSTPTSRVTSPANDSVYTTMVAQIAGTAVDDTSTSTGTSSGLTSTLGVSIRRAADGKRWNGVSWADPAAISSITVAISPGTGVKTWSLALPNAFYDNLTVAHDTFTIFTWAMDQVNNPTTNYANVESTFTIKSTFSFISSLPEVSLLWPVGGGGLSSVSSVTIRTDAVGSGITQVWMTAISSDGAYFWTGSSWGATTPADPNLDPDAYGVWLSTDSAADCSPATCSPDAIFATPRTQTGITTLFLATHTVQVPGWLDGIKYKVFAKARNSANQVAYTTATGHFFIYDASTPKLTGHASVLSLSTYSARPSWLTDFSVASGTIADNVSDVSSPRRVFMRLRDVTAGKYLNPTTLIKFDVTGADNAWSEIATTGDSWAYDFPSAQFVTGSTYTFEAYATDGPGNLDVSACPFNDPGHPPADGDDDCRTGSAGQPKFLRYFNYDKSKPSVSITSPSVATPNYVGGNYGLKVVSGTSSDNAVSATEAKVAKVEFTLQVDESEPAKRWQGNVSSEPWKAVAEDLWNTATPSGLPGDPWAVWIASNVAWFESDSYILKVRSIDNAGNVSNEASRSFYVDRSTPVSKVTSPANNSINTSMVAQIAGTAIDDTSTSTGTSSGLTASLGVSIRRAADGKRWNGVSWETPAAISSITVAISPGTGVKTWSLSLPNAFYDGLTVAHDTFTIFTWAMDRVNNPTTNYANVESTFAAKATFSFLSGRPEVSLVWPASGGGLNDVSSVTIRTDAVGSGVTQVWMTAISSDGAYFWTGSSWGATTPADPNLDPDAYGVWLSTDSAADCSP